MIHDVKITPLKIIADDRESMHMLRSDDKIFQNLEKFIFLQFIKIKLKLGIFIKNPH